MQRIPNSSKGSQYPVLHLLFASVRSTSSSIACCRLVIEILPHPTALTIYKIYSGGNSKHEKENKQKQPLVLQYPLPHNNQTNAGASLRTKIKSQSAQQKELSLLFFVSGRVSCFFMLFAFVYVTLISVSNRLHSR